MEQSKEYIIGIASSQDSLVSEMVPNTEVNVPEETRMCPDCGEWVPLSGLVPVALHEHDPDYPPDVELVCNRCAREQISLFGDLDNCE